MQPSRSSYARRAPCDAATRQCSPVDRNNPPKGHAVECRVAINVCDCVPHARRLFGPCGLELATRFVSSRGQGFVRISSGTQIRCPCALSKACNTLLASLSS